MIFTIQWTHSNDLLTDRQFFLQFSTYFNAILLLKEKSNTLAENVSQNRKRQQINTKENFWAVTARSKNAVDMWFKDLAASKPLTILQKKVNN